jgi:hypothetical protein
MSTIAPILTRTAHSAMPSAAEMFRKLDRAGKGYITSDDLKAAQPLGLDSISISADGARAADKQSDAESAIKAMDSNGDGQVTSSEFAIGYEKAKAEESKGRPVGMPPGGRKGPPGGRGAGGGPSGSTASTAYDKADANQDGTVSDLEQRAYDAKHPKLQSAAAVKTYQQVAALTGSERPGGAGAGPLRRNLDQRVDA